jgi:hypothetical protein
MSGSRCAHPTVHPPHPRTRRGSEPAQGSHASAAAGAGGWPGRTHPSGDPGPSVPRTAETGRMHPPAGRLAGAGRHGCESANIAWRTGERVADGA